MIRGYTAQQVRDAEKPHLAAGEPLMQRAAQALADRILLLLEARPTAAPPRVLLLVGSGDNGGDTLFAGAHVARSGVFAGADMPRVAVVVDALGVGSRMHEAAFADATAAGVRFIEADAVTVDALGGAVTATADAIVSSVAVPHDSRARATSDQVLIIAPDAVPRDSPPGGAVDPDVSIETNLPASDSPGRAAADYDVIVDGIIGTGTSTGSPALRGTARAVVLAIRAGLGERGAPADEGFSGPIIVAVDIPSGIDPDSGAVADDAVLSADVTVTFGGIKAGLLLGEGARLAGRLDLVEIGIEADLAAMTPVVDLP